MSAAHSLSPEPTIPLEGDHPQTPAGVQFSQILDRILEIAPANRRIFITSPCEGDGKTVTAANLALAFKARNLSVLLASLALERPRLADFFGPAPARGGVSGVVTGLSSSDRIVCRRNTLGLDLGPAGPPIAPTERLPFGKPFEEMLTSATQNYAWSIFDGPSIETSPQTAELARGVGFTLLVVRRRSSRKQLREAIAQLEGSLHLAILNNC